MSLPLKMKMPARIAQDHFAPFQRLVLGSINFLRSERDISSTGHEEDVKLMPCDEGESVCTQHPEGDEVYYMYAAVLEEFGVKIPFNAFELDILKILNVAPSQIRPTSWAFIRGFEILCKAFIRGKFYKRTADKPFSSLCQVASSTNEQLANTFYPSLYAEWQVLQTNNWQTLFIFVSSGKFYKRTACKPFLTLCRVARSTNEQPTNPSYLVPSGEFYK